MFLPGKALTVAYSSVAIVFLATIYSNFRVIHVIGVNPFILLRCSTPLIVSVLDWMFMGRTLPGKKSTVALMGIFASGALYARLKITNPNSSMASSTLISGLRWSTIWLFSFLLDMIYIKYIIERYPCSGSERTLYQNLFAAPILLMLMLAHIEDHSVSEVISASHGAHMAVASTCVAGAALSFTGMSLRSELTATQFTIMGIICKMASTLLNEIFVEPERDLPRLLSLAAVIVSSSFYKQAPLKRGKNHD